MSDSEETGVSERVEMESDNSGTALSLSVNVAVNERVRGRKERLTMEPDLTPLDEDSSSVDSGSAIDDDEEVGDRDHGAMATSNRWHFPLTDDDAIISNVDDLSVDSVDEMSVSLQIERQHKKQRVDSGSRSLSGSASKSKSKLKSRERVNCQFAAAPTSSQIGTAEDEEKGREREGECVDCIAAKSEILYLRGHRVGGLDMAKLMALESELLSALNRVQRAMANQYENEKLCIVCKRFQRDTVFRPCSHFSTCSECAQQLPKCPLCQSAVKQRFKIFQ